MRAAVCAAALVATLGVVACDDRKDITSPQQETFAATLTGGAERPNAVTTNASGNATVTFNPSTQTFSYTLNTSGLTAVTGAHIHGPATTAEAAGILVPLENPTAATVSGTFAAGAIRVSGVSVDSLLALMRNGRTYVNVHTQANPGGEIRGQLVRQ